ncbi:MAG: MinD/ParA family protein [Sedimentisphaerales bacterium]|jgi:flagellar biosynthesis protein FlhG|nr:MinD/ParA family protein [Sedimentisphaerales bacterium]
MARLIAEENTAACRHSRVIAIASGKGGVGKSTIAANISVCLVRTGMKVGLIDADMAVGNLDILLNIRCRYSVADLLTGRKGIAEVLHKEDTGLQLISGSPGVSWLADLDQDAWGLLLAHIQSIKHQTDLILIDTPSGLGRSAMQWCMAANEVWVVTTPEATSIADAYATIKTLVQHRYQGRIYLLVNMARTYRQGRQTYTRIASVAARFLGLSLPHLATIPLDLCLHEAAHMRTPLVMSHPRSAASTALNALCSRLCGRICWQGDQPSAASRATEAIC